MEDKHRPSAAQTLRCYNAMETTKRRHFDFLSLLENRQKRFNIESTESDRQLLAMLLRDHNDEVKMFKHASDELKQSDPAAHSALFEYIGQINTALVSVEAKPAH